MGFSFNLGSFCINFWSFSFSFGSFSICLRRLSLSFGSLDVSFGGFSPCFGSFCLGDRGFGFGFRIIGLGLGFGCRCGSCCLLSLYFFLFNQLWFSSRCLLGLFWWDGSLWFLLLIITVIFIITVVIAVLIFFTLFHNCSFLYYRLFFLFSLLGFCPFNLFGILFFVFAVIFVITVITAVFVITSGGISSGVSISGLLLPTFIIIFTFLTFFFNLGFLGNNFLILHLLHLLPLSRFLDHLLNPLPGLLLLALHLTVAASQHGLEVLPGRGLVVLVHQVSSQVNCARSIHLKANLLPFIEGQIERLIEDRRAEVGDNELLVIVALDHQGGNRLPCGRHLKACFCDPEWFLHLSFIPLAGFDHQAPEDVATACFHLHCCQVLFN